MREHVFTQSGDDALRRRRQQEDLYEVHHALQREQPEEAEGDAIEERAVVSLERRVEKPSHDLGEDQPHRGGDEQADRGNRQASAVGTQPGKQPAERLWRAEAPRTLSGGRRHVRSARSSTIAAKISARYTSENL